MSEVVSLLKDVEQGHRDPQSSDYNECDTSPCNWCQRARLIINASQPASATPRAADTEAALEALALAVTSALERDMTFRGVRYTLTYDLILAALKQVAHPSVEAGNYTLQEAYGRLLVAAGAVGLTHEDAVKHIEGLRGPSREAECAQEFDPIVREIIKVHQCIPRHASWTVIPHPRTGENVWLRNYLFELANDLDNRRLATLRNSGGKAAQGKNTSK